MDDVLCVPDLLLVTLSQGFLGDHSLKVISERKMRRHNADPIEIATQLMFFGSGFLETTQAAVSLRHIVLHFAPAIRCASLPLFNAVMRF